LAETKDAGEVGDLISSMEVEILLLERLVSGDVPCGRDMGRGGDFVFIAAS
jgi:hypothetical protein